jgi:hypothetical protein
LRLSEELRYLKWLSPRTARLKWSRRWCLRWCSAFRSNLGKPRRRTIHRRPLLGFERKPSPSPSHVEQDLAHSCIRSTLRHLLTFSGAIPASLGSKHGNPPRGSFPSTPRKGKPRCDTGEEPAGFQRLADWGLGASAKLAQQPKTDLNVPKIFTEYSEGPSFHANFYSSS